MSIPVKTRPFLSPPHHFLQPPIHPRILILFITVISSINLAACTSTVQPAPTSTRRAIVTAMVALLSGELIEIDGCIRVKDSDSNDGFALVWPPELKMTIENDHIKVVSGLVSGEYQERILKIGDMVELGGGIAGNLDEQLKGTIPPGCPGPYWVVGSNLSPFPPAPTPD